MKYARIAAGVLGLMSLASAQNLENGGFEADWPDERPESWSVSWAFSNGRTRISWPDTSTLQCGRQSARVDTSTMTFGSYQLAKQWNGVTANKTLRAKVRFLCPSTPANDGATIEFITSEYDTSFQPAPLFVTGDSRRHVVTPSAHWQEVTLECTTIGAQLFARFLVKLTNADDVVFYIDNIDFEGSDLAEFNGGNAIPTQCWEVKGDDLSVMVDPQTGMLREIRDLDANGVPTGANYLVDGGSPLAHIETSTSSGGAFSSPTFQRVRDIAATPGTPVWTTVGTPTAQSVTLRAQRHVPVDVGLEVTISADSSTRGVAFEHSVDGNGVTNPTTLLERVAAPELDLRRRTTTSSSDWMFLPRDVGMTAHMDEVASHVSNSSIASRLSYPGSATMQYASYYDDDMGGITLRTHDMQGEEKSLRYVLSYDTSASVNELLNVRMWWDHHLPSLPAGDQSFTPYPTFVEPSGTDWIASTERYRAAMDCAPWRVDSRREQHDLAPWVLERPTVFEADLLPLAYGQGQDLVPLQSWACLLDEWGTFLSDDAVPTRMMPLFRSFEHLGTYATPHNLPLGVLDVDSDTVLHDTTALRNAWSAVDASDHVGMAMVGGIKHAMKRTGRKPCAVPGGTANSYWVMSLDGTAPSPGFIDPKLQTLSRDRNGDARVLGPSAEWDTLHHELDPCHSFTREVHADLASELGFGSGVDLYLFDQLTVVRDNFFPDDEGNGPLHAPGAGTWKIDALSGLFADTLAAGRQENPNDFELTIEHLHELYLPWLALSGGRINKPSGFIGSVQEGTYQVPAFQHVYGDVTSFVVWDFQRIPTPGASSLMIDRKRAMTSLGRAMMAGATASVTYYPFQLLLASGRSACPNPAPAPPACPPSTPPVVADRSLPHHTHLDTPSVTLVRNIVRTEHDEARDALNLGHLVRTTGFAFPNQMVEFDVNGWTGINGTSREDLPVVHSARLYEGSVHLLFANVDAAVASHVVTLPKTADGRLIDPAKPAKVIVNGVSSTTMPYGTLSPLTIAPSDVVYIVASF